MSTTDSPAIRLIRQVWEVQWQLQCSYDRINHALQAALQLCIRYHLPFARADFMTLAVQFRFVEWCGGDAHHWGEQWYSAACENRYGVHRSAALAFEHWKHRPPFLYQDILYGCPTRQKKRRLCVNSAVMWFDIPVALRVMTLQQDAVIACGEVEGTRRVVRITREELQRWNAAHAPKKTVKEDANA